ncbi:FAD-binding oxidoreductase [Micromonospora sp. M12]
MPTLTDDDHPAHRSLATAWASVDERAAADFWSTSKTAARAAPAPRRAAVLHRAGPPPGRRRRPAGRSALLTVLGHAYRHFDLLPHSTTIGDALLATVARHAHPLWTSPLALTAERALCRAMHAIRRAAGRPVTAGLVARPGHRPRPAVPDIATLTVRPWRRLPYQPGQAVPVCTPRLPGHWRWLSPANAPRADGTVELHVRAVPAGTVSHRLVHEVRPGELLWLGPPGDTGLCLDRVSTNDLLLVAGGTGLAPLRALVEQVAAAPDGRRVTLVVGARTFTDLYDPIALDKLQCAHDWLTVVPAFSDDRFAEPAEQGDALTIALDHHQPGQDIYLCGPPAMLAGARSRLLARGVPATRIHLPEGFTR